MLEAIDEVLGYSESFNVSIPVIYTLSGIAGMHRFVRRTALPYEIELTRAAYYNFLKQFVLLLRIRSKLNRCQGVKPDFDVNEKRHVQT